MFSRKNSDEPVRRRAGAPDGDAVSGSSDANPGDATEPLNTSSDATTEILNVSSPGSGAESDAFSAPEPNDETSTIATKKRVPVGASKLSGQRLIWVIAGVAAVAMVAGIVLTKFIISPAQAAADAEPPTPGLITVPIDERVVSNTVTTRGDVKYADSVDVKLETGDLGGSPVVTGQVPEAGAIFNPGSIALEVVGRPVIVLPGDLPVYRTLRAGLSGPDVLQLKQALASMGFESGSLDSNVYDSSTAAGVKALYESVGYTPPTSTNSGTGASAGASGADPVSQAQNDVQSAQQGLVQAQSALSQAQAPNLVEQAQADNTVREAQRALNTATAAGDPNAIAAANDALALAALQQSIAYAPKDASAEIAQVTAAQSALTMAQEALVNAQESALTSLPASEVLYLNSLPRRVDEVSVKRGGVLNGVAMTVSGATLQVVSTVSKADAELLKPGTTAEFPAPDDSMVSAEVLSVEPQKSTGDKKGTTSYDVVLAPKDLTESQLTALKGTNVKVTIPVSATDGKVLAVPLAAVQAGPGGESRIEVLLDAEKQETKLITVETGLAADGYVEVKATKDGAFGSGDPVVVGR